MENGSHTAGRFISGLIKAAVSLAALAALILYAEAVFRPKYTEETRNDSPSTTFVRGFYDLPENSIEVLFIGNSETFYNVNPLVIWKESGVRSHVFASPAQRMNYSLFYMREALKTQSPRYIFLDVSRIFSPIDDLSEARSQKTLGDVPFSFEKLEFIKERVAMSGGESVISYLSSIFRYHDRWPSLDYPYDFSIPLGGARDGYRGYAPLFRTKTVRMDMKRCERGDPEAGEMPEYSASCLRDMKAACEAAGAELILIKAPTGAAWNITLSESVADVAEAEGLRYYDLWPLASDIGIDVTTDYADTTHLNYAGAEKYSGHLAALLTGELGLTGENSDADARSLWEADHHRYVRDIKARDIAKIEDFSEYLDAIDDRDYALFISVRNDASRGFSQELDDKLRALGPRESLIGKYRWAYIAVADGGELIYEKHAKEPLEYSFNYRKNHIYLKSVGLDDGNLISMIVNGTDHTKDLIQRGIHIIVYDKILDRIVDNVCYHTDRQRMYRERSGS